MRLRVMAAIGGWLHYSLTFVFLLDVGVAQAHQAHLEAQHAHLAVASAKWNEE